MPDHSTAACPHPRRASDHDVLYTVTPVKNLSPFTADPWENMPDTCGYPLILLPVATRPPHLSSSSPPSQISALHLHSHILRSPLPRPDHHNHHNYHHYSNIHNTFPTSSVSCDRHFAPELPPLAFLRPLSGDAKPSYNELVCSFNRRVSLISKSSPPELLPPGPTTVFGTWRISS